MQLPHTKSHLTAPPAPIASGRLPWLLRIPVPPFTSASLTRPAPSPSGQAAALTCPICASCVETCAFARPALLAAARFQRALKWGNRNPRRHSRLPWAVLPGTLRAKTNRHAWSQTTIPNVPANRPSSNQSSRQSHTTVGVTAARNAFPFAPKVHGTTAQGTASKASAPLGFSFRSNGGTLKACGRIQCRQSHTERPSYSTSDGTARPERLGTSPVAASHSRSAIHTRIIDTACPKTLRSGGSRDLPNLRFICRDVRVCTTDLALAQKRSRGEPGIRARTHIVSATKYGTFPLPPHPRRFGASIDMTAAIGEPLRRAVCQQRITGGDLRHGSRRLAELATSKSGQQWHSADASKILETFFSRSAKFTRGCDILGNILAGSDFVQVGGQTK
jgi:hypothetical protein